MVKQISVFLENKEGRVAEVTRCLADNGINIRALSIADTTDFGILRLIVNDPDLAYEVLKKSEFTVSVKNVLVFEILDEPGSLAKALQALRDNGIVVEYLYAFLGKEANRGMVTIKVPDNDKAAGVLGANGITIVDAQDIFDM